ncbi:MAG: hypothetical protein WDM92_04875 [Caulobacteraceae bacterium]
MGPAGDRHANAATLAAGLALIGLTACLPIYIQAVLGRSPIVSGLTLTAMAVGWPIAATLSARLFLPWFGMRATLRGGAVTMLVGAAALPFVNPSNGVWLSSAGSLLMGAGMGMMSYTAVLLLQASVGWEQRGAATASNVFARLLGNTLGAAVMGAILNLGLSLAGARVSSERVRALMEPTPGAGRAGRHGAEKRAGGLAALGVRGDVRPGGADPARRLGHAAPRDRRAVPPRAGQGRGPARAQASRVGRPTNSFRRSTKRARAPIFM